MLECSCLISGFVTADKDETVSVLMPPQTTQALHLSEKNMDLTDGSVCVRVEHCNRQFYMENKEKVCLH